MSATNAISHPSFHPSFSLLRHLDFEHVQTITSRGISGVMYSVCVETAKYEQHEIWGTYVPFGTTDCREHDDCKADESLARACASRVTERQSAEREQAKVAEEALRVLRVRHSKAAVFHIEKRGYDR